MRGDEEPVSASGYHEKLILIKRELQQIRKIMS
jgi:hypothetical protein